MLEEQDDELLEDADCQEELARPAWQKKFFQGQNRPAEKEMSEYQKRLLGRFFGLKSALPTGNVCYKV